MSRGIEKVFAQAMGGIDVCRFGDERYRGFHDCAKGVQWHIAEEPGADTCYLAVNLEGLKYGSTRPIHLLVTCEASEPRLAAVVRGLASPESIYVHVVREGWPSQRTRVYLDDQYRCILSAPAAAITDDLWASAMKAASACLSADGNRGRQFVRRPGNPVAVMMDVLPHITVGMTVWTGPMPSDAVERVVGCRRILEPVHAAMTASTMRPDTRFAH